MAIFASGGGNGERGNVSSEFEQFKIELDRRLRAELNNINPRQISGDINKFPGVLRLEKGGLGSSMSEPSEDMFIYFNRTKGAFDWVKLGEGLKVSNGELVSEKVAGNIVVDANSMASVGFEITSDFLEGLKVFSVFSSLADFLCVNVGMRADVDFRKPIMPYVLWNQAIDIVPNIFVQYRWQSYGGEWKTDWLDVLCNVTQEPYSTGIVIQKCIFESPLIAQQTATKYDILQLRIFRDTQNDTAYFNEVDLYPLELEVLGVGVDFNLE